MKYKMDSTLPYQKLLKKKGKNAMMEKILALLLALLRYAN
jgi:hypothetical protein